MSCNAQLYYCYVSKIPFIFVLLVITFLYLFVRIKCDNPGSTPRVCSYPHSVTVSTLLLVDQFLGILVIFFPLCYSVTFSENVTLSSWSLVFLQFEALFFKSLIYRLHQVL